MKKGLRRGEGELLARFPALNYCPDEEGIKTSLVRDALEPRVFELLP